MSDDRHLTPEDEALVTQHCEKFLAGDVAAPPVDDEAVYSYLIGSPTDDEREAVEEALLSSRGFCDELLELAGYLGSLPARRARARAPRRWRIRWSMPRLAAAASAAVVILVAGALLLGRWQTAHRLPSAMHLAVLPIECVGDAVTGAFCDGFAATVTAQVSRFERFNRTFWVVPAHAVAKAQVSDPAAAGNEFGVTLVLTGHLERHEGKFRLTLDLLNLASPTPKRIRSTSITGPMAQLPALQTTVVRRVGKMLDLSGLGQAGAGAREEETEVPAAFLSYVQGRGHLLRYEQTAELERAVDAFTTAIAQDSSYALARTGLAEAYWRLYRATGDTAWIGRAREACERSLALDDSLALTYVALGNILNESGSYDQAVAAFDHATALDSTTAGVYNGLAASYAGLGKLDDAEATYRRAIRVKPDYWGGYSDLGLFLYRHGRFADAADQYRKITELTPNNYLAFNNLGGMYYYLERWNDARAALQRSLAIQPNDRAYLDLGSIDYIEGDYKTAAQRFERAVALNPNSYKAWAAVGNASYWLPGGKDRATQAYRRAITLAEKRLALNPKDARLRATLASYYVMVGEKEKARSYVETALQGSSKSPFVLYFAGYVYEQLGNRSRALELIGQAIKLGYPVREIERDPWLTDLRADKRFQQLLDSRK